MRPMEGRSRLCGRGDASQHPRSEVRKDNWDFSPKTQLKHEDPGQEQRGTAGAQQRVGSGADGPLEVSQLSDDTGKGARNPLVQLVRHARKVGVSAGSKGTLTPSK